MSQRTIRGKGGSGFKWFPDATYPLRCHEIKETKSLAGNDMIELHCDIIHNGSAHKVREFLVLSENMAWKLEQLMKAWGVPFEKVLIDEKMNEERQEMESIFDFTFDPNEFIGRCVEADIVVSSKPSREDKSRIVRFYAIEQYRDRLTADPNWPESAWLEKVSKSNSTGPKTVTGNGAEEDDTPF